MGVLLSAILCTLHATQGDALCLPCSLATFYSRSRKGRWCKGETSGHYIKASSGFSIKPL